MRLVRLKRSESWPNQGQGFSFVLAQGGSGHFASGSASQNVQPGDLLVLKCTDGGKISATADELVFWCFSVCFEYLFPLFAIGEISLLQNTTENLKGAKLYPASSPLALECHQLVAKAPPQGNVDHRLQVLRVAAAVLSAEFRTARNQRVRVCSGSRIISCGFLKNCLPPNCSLYRLGIWRTSSVAVAVILIACSINILGVRSPP